MELRGCCAVVTGASSGIGAATARALADRGARVALVARTRDALEEVAADIGRSGATAAVHAADLTDARAAASAAEAIRGDLGVPDVLVNNAGAGRFLFIDETAPDEAESMMAVPYFAAFNMTRAVLPDMLARDSGRVLIVNSPASYVAWPGACGYTAARFAMRGFTEGLRADLHGTGVGVSSVTAGKVRSPYFDNNPGSEERIPTITRIIRTLTPEEVAHAVVDALERDKRDVYVPLMLRMNVLQSRFMPRLSSWVLARTGAKRPVAAGERG
ncbi:MAG TPA: SDR family NAD(P)-dependent oxidoreductase [Thermoleophilaceae bacterium]